jgi:hypothetical protein
MKPQSRASFNLISGSATQPYYENKTQNPNPSVVTHKKYTPPKVIKILPNATSECNKLLRRRAENHCVFLGLASIAGTYSLSGRIHV